MGIFYDNTIACNSAVVDVKVTLLRPSFLIVSSVTYEGWGQAQKEGGQEWMVDHGIAFINNWSNLEPSGGLIIQQTGSICWLYGIIGL